MSDHCQGQTYVWTWPWISIFCHTSLPISVMHSQLQPFNSFFSLIFIFQEFIIILPRWLESSVIFRRVTGNNNNTADYSMQRTDWYTYWISGMLCGWHSHSVSKAKILATSAVMGDHLSGNWISTTILVLVAPRATIAFCGMYMQHSYVFNVIPFTSFCKPNQAVQGPSPFWISCLQSGHALVGTSAVGDGRIQSTRCYDTTMEVKALAVHA